MLSAAYLFLYIPIVILVIFSFNSSELPFIWEGFSLQWYQALWASSDIWHALKNSLIVAFSSVVLSLTIGLFFVFYGARTILARFFMMFYASLATPEIVLAVGLLSLVFIFFYSAWLNYTYCRPYPDWSWIRGSYFAYALSRT